MKIEDIKIGVRHRKNNGDLGALADSIKKHGLLQPIGVTENNELVFGYRRLMAVQMAPLWWRDIDVRIVNVASIVAGEFAENEIRKDFTVSERVAIMKTIENTIGNRQGQRTDQLRKNFNEVPPGERTSKIAALRAGFGNETTAREARKVVDGGVDELVEAVDRGEVAINAGSFIARETPSVQREILKAPEQERRSAVGKLRTAAKRSSPPDRSPKRQPPPQRKSIEWPTPTEVDPEFKGTPVEFTDKYGHVPILTGEQYATERFGAWAGNIGAVAKEAKRMPDWPNVDHNWLRSPRPRDLVKMTEALEYLRPKIAEAEALLDRAREAEEAKRPAPCQPDAVSLPSA